MQQEHDLCILLISLMAVDIHKHLKNNICTGIDNTNSFHKNSFTILQKN